MSATESGWGGAVGAALRAVAGVVTGGLLAAVAWGVIFAYAFDHRWTTANDIRTIGLLRNHEPLNAAKRGFVIVCAVALVLAALVVLTRRWLPKPFVPAALIVAGLVFVGWGAIFGPLSGGKAYAAIEGQRVPSPSGLFGTDGGRATPIVGLLAALTAGFVLVRCQRVMADAWWWRPGRSLGTRGGDFSSLELSEEGAKERDVGAAGDSDALGRA